MKYIIKLLDKNDEVLLEEETQVAQVAQKILDNCKAIEETGITVEQIVKSRMNKI